MEMVEMSTEEAEEREPNLQEENSWHILGRKRRPKGKQTTEDKVGSLTLQLQVPKGL